MKWEERGREKGGRERREGKEQRDREGVGEKVEWAVKREVKILPSQL